MDDAPFRLLIIEDRPDALRPLLAALEGKGWHVVTAATGASGLEKAGRLHPDLILLEMDLPDMDGITVCAQLKGDPDTSEIMVIYLAGSTTTEDKLRGFRCGAVDYITKPYSVEEAVARIQVHLQIRQQCGRLEAMAERRALDVAGTAAHPDQRLFWRAISLLGQNLANPISMDTIAGSLGSYTRKLNEIFLRKTGMTMFEYHTEMRLETGRRLLETSGLQIRQISGLVGYRNQGDFTRAFRKRYGAAPRSFRLTDRPLAEEEDESGDAQA
ncbi:MAG TPA: DNA-binding response regulator [Parasulfuritortus sp.]